MGKGNKKYGLGKRGGEAFEVDLPSGEVCLMRKISADDLIDLGIIDDLDSLTGIVQTEHIDRVAGKTQVNQAAQTLAGLDPSTAEGRTAIMDIIKDKKRWDTLMAFVNKVVVRAVLEPPTYDRDAAKPGDQQLGTAIAVQDVDLPDRMVIMARALSQVQDGVLAAEPFREKRDDDVANVPDGEGVQLTTVDALGRDIPAGS